MIWSVRAYLKRPAGAPVAPRGVVRLEARYRELPDVFREVQRVLPVGWRLAPLTLEPEDAEANALLHEIPGESSNLPRAWEPNRWTSSDWRRLIGPEERRYLDVVRGLEPRASLVSELDAASRFNQGRARRVRWGLESAAAYRFRHEPKGRRCVCWVATGLLEPGEELPLLELSR